MAVNVRSVPGAFAAYRTSDTDVDSTVQDVTGATKLLGAWVDNTSNAAASYVKFYDSASGSVTVGTTVPEVVLYVPAGAEKQFNIPGGVTFSTAVSYCCVTTGGTGGTTDPTSAVKMDALLG